MRRLLILACTLSLAACLDVRPTPDEPTDPSTETFAPELGVDISTMVKTSLGDYYKDIVVGDGPALAAPVQVTMTYEGFLKNGLLFGQQTGEPVNLSLNVPTGLRDAMLGMRVHGERLIVIPSELGYGPNQNGPIPPNSTLVFHVLLESIIDSP